MHGGTMDVSEAVELTSKQTLTYFKPFAYTITPDGQSAKTTRCVSSFGFFERRLNGPTLVRYFDCRY